MDGYTTLYGILETALKQAGGECGTLLGQELSITLSESLLTSKSSYFGESGDGRFIIGINSGEPYGGQFYLLFPLQDAIVISSILLGIPPTRIQEKKRLSIVEKEDIEAFAEIGNTVKGALKNTFLASLSNKVSLELLPPRKYVPEVDELTPEQPLPDGDYLMFRSKLGLPGQEMEYLDLLIPTALGDLFDPQTAVVETEGDGIAAGVEKAAGAVEVSGSVAAKGAGDDSATTDSAAQGGVESVILLEDDADLRHQIVELLAFTGFQIAEGTLNADLKELFAGRNVKMAVIGSQNADDSVLAVCIKVHAMRQDSPPPIIMISERWTRIAALKALKYGASDIIIKPFDAEEVVAKVRRYCKIDQV